ncbi:MAG TPA: hypothetical protein VNU68_06480 [Verrucomicrobiae bacterium]|nr:hypothetical protein [Verrucomicrobiae bacterium]
MTWLYTPPWHTRVIVAVAVVLLALALMRWWRERRGGALVTLRVLLVGALLWVALNPQALLQRERTGKPKLAILIDTSASMRTRDVDNSARLAAALRVLTNSSTVAGLEKEFVLDLRRFDRDLAPADLPKLSASDAASGDASDIASAVMSVVSELGDAPAQAGVLLISDGRATTPNTLDAAQLALARSVPLWTWTLGGPVAKHDLWIETASSEALAFSGAEVELNATLRATGYPNRSFKVELLRDDKVIESREVIPDTNGTARVSLKVKAPDAGEQRYVFRVPPQPEEGDTANNDRAVFLRSVGDKVRVLVAEGQPHWDTKFLVQGLKRDPNVDLTAVYRLNAQRHVAIISSTGAETRVEHDLFPRTAEAMNAFDVIVLGRGAEAFFDNTTEDLLTDFTAKRGGSVVFARGKPYGGRFQPLAKFEPVAWGSGSTPSVKLKPTEAGRDNPIFDLGTAGTLDELLERLPALDHASITLGEKPLAVSLATAADKSDGPVLVAYQRYGQGKALSLNASGLWRWAFRESGQEESEVAYRRFWISLLQWLLSGSQFLPGSEVALTSARRYYTSEQPMQFLISTRNLDALSYQPKLVIEGTGHTIEVDPRARGGNFVAEAGPFAPGTYRVTLKNNVGKPAELSQSVEVLSASVEKRDLSADAETMRRLAQVSGGQTLAANDIARMPSIVQRWEAARQLAHRQRPVWDRWWVLAAMFALLGAEWWLRRREGLL